MKVNNFDDMYAVYDFYKNHKGSMESYSVSLKCIEEYQLYMDDDFYDKCAEDIENIIKEKKMRCYLFVMRQKYNVSDKIFNYYKVWKSLNLDAKIIDLGQEKKYIINNLQCYISVGEFEIEEIKSVIKFLIKNKSNTLLYCCKSKIISEFELQNRIYDMLCNEDNIVDKRYSFGLREVFKEMKKDEMLVCAAFDGEVIRVDMYNKK